MRLFRLILFAMACVRATCSRTATLGDAHDARFCSFECATRHYGPAASVRIASAAGDELAEKLLSHVRVVAWDFDQTLIAAHSCGATRTHPTDYSIAVSAQMRAFIDQVDRRGKRQWIVSYGDPSTVCLTLARAGLTRYFSTPVAEVRADARGDLMVRRLMRSVDGGEERMWHVITPSRMGMGYGDCEIPPHGVSKADFLVRLLSVLDMLRFTDAAVKPSEVLLIDDGEQNARDCAAAGFQALAVPKEKAFARALKWPDAGSASDAAAAADPLPSGSDRWFKHLFDEVERVSRQDHAVTYQYWKIY